MVEGWIEGLTTRITESMSNRTDSDPLISLYYEHSDSDYPDYLSTEKTAKSQELIYTYEPG